MFPYWILFAVSAAGALNARSRGPSSVGGSFFLTALGLLTALMIGLRFEVGADWLSYEEIFDYIGYLDVSDTVVMGDPAYGLLNWLAHALDAEIWAVNLACAIIFIWGLLKFCRQQPNPWLAYVVAVPYLIIVVGMGYTRQGVAIALLLAGLSTLSDRQSMMRFAIYIILATAFHKTTLVVLPLVMLSAVRRKILTAALMVVLGGLLYYLFLDAAVDRLLFGYVETEYDSQGAAIRVGMNLIPAALFLIFSRRFDIPEMARKIWRNFALASFALLALLFLLPSSTLVDRLALYLIPLQLFVLSRLPGVFAERGKDNWIVILGVIAYSGTVQLVWMIGASHAEYWLPYQAYPLSTP